MKIVHIKYKITNHCIWEEKQIYFLGIKGPKLDSDMWHNLDTG
jgi:hypothetical protein